MKGNKLAILAADLIGAPYARKSTLEHFGIHFKKKIEDREIDADFCRALIYALNGKVSSEYHTQRVFAHEPQVPQEYEECMEYVIRELEKARLDRLHEKRTSLIRELDQVNEEIIKGTEACKQKS